MIERKLLLKVADDFRASLEAGDNEGWLDLFSETFSFKTSFMEQPCTDKTQLREQVSSWPNVLNRTEWSVIEKNRMVQGWSERLPTMRDSAPSYRGISSILVNDEGLIVEYEGVFDTAAVLAAVSTTC